MLFKTSSVFSFSLPVEDEEDDERERDDSEEEEDKGDKEMAGAWTGLATDPLPLGICACCGSAFFRTNSLKSSLATASSSSGLRSMFAFLPMKLDLLLGSGLNWDEND
ncbi:hypothetical protein BpHYR1_037973 [Brachionus plicatilis]|uniref:Uncharacterized protein n=1 Tax=Brachionus plicatilis TaxID=10195 RepID=A0A3M7QLX6_BRAPC|nr:hypothetical protein BpHYR1_037973 [Brachionus plicatilis]